MNAIPTAIIRTRPTLLHPSPNYEKLCKHFEGLYCHAYDDGGGTWTIGWGHTRGVRRGDTCSIVMAEQYFAADTEEATAAVNRQINVDLSQNEYDAVVDFTFNEGEGHLEQSTARRLLNIGKYEDGLLALLMWDKMNHRTIKGLHLRRESEIQLALKGTLPF